jgi:protocatechuate 4,5-dioxygenase alpha chain
MARPSATSSEGRAHDADDIVEARLYPADLADIPGTTIFTTASSRRAYRLHSFCMSLMKRDNRAAFKANEAGYLAGHGMSDEQRDAVLARDYNRLIALGGNFYFLVKLERDAIKLNRIPLYNSLLSRDLLRKTGSHFFASRSSQHRWLERAACGRTMTGMTAEEYGAMMVAGGRSPEGNRSTRRGN